MYDPPLLIMSEIFDIILSILFLHNSATLFVLENLHINYSLTKTFQLKKRKKKKKTLKGFLRYNYNINLCNETLGREPLYERNLNDKVSENEN